MRSLLHVLPHSGGGGERVVEMLEGLGAGYLHDRFVLSPTREPLRAAPSIAARWPRLARRAGAADLLDVMGDMATLLCLPLLARRPAVVQTQGLHFLRRARGARRRVAERGLRVAAARAACIVCSSTAERDELLSIAEPAHEPRLRVVLNGIPVGDPPTPEERRRARRELGLADGCVVGLFLGELEQRKDPLTAIRAVRAAAGRGSAVALLVAGEGPLLDAACEEAGAAVRVLGFRDDPDRLAAAADFLILPSHREGLSLAVLEAMAAGVPVVAADVPASREAVGHEDARIPDRLAAAADFLILPSHREGLSLAVLEAMAAGVPVVAADVPASREAVGDTGVLVPAGDVDAFARACERLAADPELRGRLGRAAHERAAARFSIERYLAEMREVFEESVEQWEPRHSAE